MQPASVVNSLLWVVLCHYTTEMEKINIYAVQQDTQSFSVIEFIHHIC